MRDWGGCGCGGHKCVSHQGPLVWSSFGVKNNRQGRSVRSHWTKKGPRPLLVVSLSSLPPPRSNFTRVHKIRKRTVPCRRTSLYMPIKKASAIEKGGRMRAQVDAPTRSKRKEFGQVSWFQCLPGTSRVPSATSVAPALGAKCHQSCAA